MVSIENKNEIVIIADHEGVDDNDYSKRNYSQPCHLGALTLSHSKRLLNDVLIALDGSENNKIYYSHTDATYIQKNDHKTLKKQGLIRKEIFQSKNDYGDSGNIYGVFLAPEIKYCFVINDDGLIQQKVTFKGCDPEISLRRFKEFLNMEKGLIVRKISKLKWKRKLFIVKVPHRVFNCEYCQNDKMCHSCIKDPKKNCFDCKISMSCDKCLERKTQIKVASIEIIKLKRQSPDEKAYLLPHYVGEDVVEEEENDQTQVSYGKFNESFVEFDHDNYLKNRKT